MLSTLDLHVFCTHTHKKMEAFNTRKLAVPVVLRNALLQLKFQSHSPKPTWNGSSNAVIRAGRWGLPISCLPREQMQGQLSIALRLISQNYSCKCLFSTPLPAHPPNPAPPSRLCVPPLLQEAKTMDTAEFWCTILCRGWWPFSADAPAVS